MKEEKLKITGICTIIIRDKDKRVISIERKKNVITNAGKAYVAKLIGGIVTAPFSYIQIGTGTTTPSPSDTALESFYAEKQATAMFVEPSSVVFSAMFDFTESANITESGVFSGPGATSPVMLCREVFGAKSVSAGQYLEVSWKVTIT